MKLVVSSKNPVKINATSSSFALAFPDETWDVVSVSVPSGVPDQPHGDEILTGAINRVHAARKLEPAADYWVGIEGGTEDSDGGMVTYAWTVILSADGKLAKSNTSAITLPPRVVELIREGKELGEASDIVFDESNSKQSMGTTGLLTHNIVSREDSYKEAMIIALIPFMNPELYP